MAESELCKTSLLFCAFLFVLLSISNCNGRTRIRDTGTVSTTDATVKEDDPADALPTIASADEMAELHSQYDDLPPECRIDMCIPSNTSDNKGNFQWGWAYAGEYAYQPCPYGVWPKNPIIDTKIEAAYRPCFPPTSENHIWRRFKTANWGDANTEACRYSSETTNRLHDIKNQIIDVVKEMVRTKLNNVTAIIDLLQEANVVVFFARDISSYDVEYVASIIEISVQSAILNVYPLVREVGTQIVRLADKMLNEDEEMLSSVEEACLSIASSLEDYTEHVQMSMIEDSISHVTNNIYVELHNTGVEISDLPLLQWFFRAANDTSDSQPVASISIPIYPGTHIDQGPGQSDGTPVQLSSGLYRTASIVYYSAKFFTSANRDVAPVDNNVLVYVHVYHNGKALDTLKNPLHITFYHPMSNWDTKEILCSSAHLTSNLTNVTSDNTIREVDFQWSSMDCDLNVTTQNYTICLCRVMDLIALIQEVLPTPTPTPKPCPPDTWSFIGIPYSLGLAIASYVGYSISILSMILTLATYAMFPKVRRGRPTLILINLCIAVFFLVTVLLTAITFCHTQIGCRIANILRVYFILVSMMWNGVEAVHMYLALVKVFTSYTSHFVLKAGIIAWGVPLIIILIAVTVNVETFDGEMVDCSFNCHLSNVVFYTVFLLPMLIIMVFNSIVFAMVLRVVLRIYNKDGEKSMMSQLQGAVALMVLLGLTWALGAASAVNYQYYESEDDVQPVAVAVQSLFVLCVAFQGFFIFVFHCLRYKDVRQEWVSFFKHNIRRLSKCTTKTKQALQGAKSPTTSQADASTEEQENRVFTISSAKSDNGAPL